MAGSDRAENPLPGHRFLPRALPGAIHQCDPAAAPGGVTGGCGGERRKTDRIKITELAGPREGWPAR